MNEIKSAKLIRTQGGRALELPAGFDVPAEFEGPDAQIVVVKQGDKLIFEPSAGDKRARPATFRQMLDRMDTIDVEWPDVDEGLLPADDINL